MVLRQTELSTIRALPGSLRIGATPVHGATSVSTLVFFLDCIVGTLHYASWAQNSKKGRGPKRSKRSPSIDFISQEAVDETLPTEGKDRTG